MVLSVVCHALDMSPLRGDHRGAVDRTRESAASGVHPFVRANTAIAATPHLCHLRPSGTVSLRGCRSTALRYAPICQPVRCIAKPPEHSLDELVAPFSGNSKRQMDCEVEWLFHSMAY